MSYEKQTWQTGDTVTSAKLNHMEDGIASAGGASALIVTNTDGTLDKTWQEIHDAIPLVWVTDGEGGYNLAGAAYEDEGDYCVNVIEPQPAGNHIITYVADSASGYPAISN